jgi:hypothetical protein
MRMKKGHVTGNGRKAVNGTATSCERRTAELLDRLQNGTHRGKGVRPTSQHLEGWGLGQNAKQKPQGWRVCQSRVLEKKKIYVWFEENFVFTGKFL